MTLLNIENLTVSINTAQGPIDIIKQVDLRMAAGEKLGIVGESGCGKSITALAIMSLLPEKSTVSGTVHLNGEDLLGLSPAQMCKIRGNQVAMIFQEPMTALNPVKTIGNQIAESLYLHLNLGKKRGPRAGLPTHGECGSACTQISAGTIPSPAFRWTTAACDDRDGYCL